MLASEWAAPTAARLELKLVACLAALKAAQTELLMAAPLADLMAHWMADTRVEQTAAY